MEETPKPLRVDQLNLGDRFRGGPIRNVIQILLDRSAAGDVEAKKRLEAMGIKLP